MPALLTIPASTPASTPATIPATIGPLIRRHAEDAAFYWQYIDSSRTAVHLGRQKLGHFDRMLGAHLEGLQLAGAEGLSATLVALDRWKKAGESFVSCWLAMQLQDSVSLEQALSIVCKQPDSLLRGVISAIARLPQPTARNILQRWTGEHAETATAVAALRAMALLGSSSLYSLSCPLSQWLRHPNASVRASACRVAAVRRNATHTMPSVPQANDDAALTAAMDDSDDAVRAEAAMALATSSQRSRALVVLWRCVVTQSAHAQQATGWYRQQALRRLDRWVRHLAVMVPLRHADVQGLYAFLPARVGLVFALHHGDPAHLPYVIGKMADEEVARQAGWVWQTLTGVDLEAHGLALHDADDTGLPMPDGDAVRQAQVALRLEVGVPQRMLRGRFITDAWLVELLQQAPQAVRSVAAHALRQRLPGMGLSVRGPVELQDRQLAYLAEQRGAASLLPQPP